MENGIVNIGEVERLPIRRIGMLIGKDVARDEATLTSIRKPKLLRDKKKKNLDNPAEVVTTRAQTRSTHVEPKNGQNTMMDRSNRSLVNKAPFRSHGLARKNLEFSQKFMKIIYAKKTANKNFKEGEEVLILPPLNENYFKSDVNVHIL